MSRMSFAISSSLNRSPSLLPIFTLMASASILRLPRTRILAMTGPCPTGFASGSESILGAATTGFATGALGAGRARGARRGAAVTSVVASKVLRIAMKDTGGTLAQAPGLVKARTRRVFSKSTTERTPRAIVFVFGSPVV